MGIVTQSEQMGSNHRHTGYKPAALPLSYVPVCFSVRTPDNRISNNLFFAGMQSIRAVVPIAWRFPQLITEFLLTSATFVPTLEVHRLRSGACFHQTNFRKDEHLGISNSFMLHYNIFGADISDKTDKL